MISHIVGSFIRQVFVSQCPKCIDDPGELYEALKSLHGLRKPYVDHNEYERMAGGSVYRAKLRAACQIPFSGLQGNDPIPWLR